MNFEIEWIEGKWMVRDGIDMYGPFDKYKEATNFMEEQLSILKEYGEWSI